MTSHLTPTLSLSPSELRIVPMFRDLPNDELEWLASRMEVLELAQGELVFSPGEKAVWMYIGLEGTVQAKRDHLGPGSPVFVFRAGDVAGVIPYSRMLTFGGTARAVTDSRVARFPKAEFPALLDRIPVLRERFVTHLVDRVRDATRRDAQFEKVLALGKLSAGLAHELNNPVAAVLQALNEGRRRIDQRGRLTAALLRGGVSSDAVMALDALRVSASPAHRRAHPKVETALERADREAALTEWLDSAGVADPWVSASTFAEAGIDKAMLLAAVAHVSKEACASALAWLEVGIASEGLFAAAEEAASRVSQVVDVMRSYTNMDRAGEMADVDVRVGLDTAVRLLSTKTKAKGVAIERSYADGLPGIRAYPADLNQVWHNLLDNAVDAAPAGSGRVKVSATVEEGAVGVVVGDNGPGIPADLQSRVWEPFFTTKDVGLGLGLGLDVARRIVVDEHGGDIALSSVPGDTQFRVRLPLTTMGTFGA